MKPNDFGKRFLVEECQRIKFSDLLRKYRNALKESVIGSEMETMDTKIELITSKTEKSEQELADQLASSAYTRYWFKCPLCGTRIGVLLKHPLTNALGCRKCLNLDYKKRRYKGMLESSI